MATNFPWALDSFTNPDSTSYQDSAVVPHATQHANANDAIEALETSVWITGSADTSSLRYMQERLTTKWDILVHNWTNYIKKAVWTNWYMLVSDNTQATGLNWIAPTSWGTVTSVSVTPANWLTGTVANPTTTPAITLWTTITGVLKGNWTAISAASAWTDYYAPWSTDVAVADWWTWVSALTAYAPIFWGTTWTWAVQSWTVWTAWQVLTSNWAWTLPTFQNGIVWRTTAVATMVNPSANTVANTTNYGTTITFSGWLVIGTINWAIQWVDMNGTIGVEWSANWTSWWTTIISATAFAYFWNSFSAWIITPVEWAIIAPWYIRTFATTSWVSMTGSWLTLWTTYFRY